MITSHALNPDAKRQANSPVRPASLDWIGLDWDGMLAGYGNVQTRLEHCGSLNSTTTQRK